MLLPLPMLTGAQALVPVDGLYALARCVEGHYGSVICAFPEDRNNLGGGRLCAPVRPARAGIRPVAGARGRRALLIMPPTLRQEALPDWERLLDRAARDTSGGRRIGRVLLSL